MSVDIFFNVYFNHPDHISDDDFNYYQIYRDENPEYGNILVYHMDDGGHDNAYIEQDGWSNENYRTIYIYDHNPQNTSEANSGATNSDLISWLYDNATLMNGGQSQSFNSKKLQDPIVVDMTKNSELIAQTIIYELPDRLVLYAKRSSDGAKSNLIIIENNIPINSINMEDIRFRIHPYYVPEGTYEASTSNAEENILVIPSYLNYNPNESAYETVRFYVYYDEETNELSYTKLLLNSSSNNSIYVYEKIIFDDITVTARIAFSNQLLDSATMSYQVYITGNGISSTIYAVSSVVADRFKHNLLFSSRLLYEVSKFIISNKCYYSFFYHEYSSDIDHFVYYRYNYTNNSNSIYYYYSIEGLIKREIPTKSDYRGLSSLYLIDRVNNNIYLNRGSESLRGLISYLVSQDNTNFDKYTYANIVHLPILRGENVSELIYDKCLILNDYKYLKLLVLSEIGNYDISMLPIYIDFPYLSTENPAIHLRDLGNYRFQIIASELDLLNHSIITYTIEIDLSDLDDYFYVADPSDFKKTYVRLPNENAGSFPTISGITLSDMSNTTEGLVLSSNLLNHDYTDHREEVNGSGIMYIID